MSHQDAASLVNVYEEPPELGAPLITHRLFADDFDQTLFVSTSSKRLALDSQPYILIGFDTEFKTPSYTLTKDDIKAGAGKYKVLSYQFHAKSSDGSDWQGILCPKDDERITLAEFLIFVFSKRPDRRLKISPQIFLVGHFTRADLPAFSDFSDQASYLSNVRNTFVSIDEYQRVAITAGDDVFNLKVVIRDTMLLTPQSAKSLKGLGELLGVPKLMLDDDMKKHREKITAMDKVRCDDWRRFKAYALMDATICLRYIERMIAQYHLVTGKHKVPVTLTSIGVDLLLKKWNERYQVSHLDLLGSEELSVRYFSKVKNRYVVKKEVVPIEEFSHYIDFITESYHGGRNEQYWFGPGTEGNWVDVDLAGAYPTAMSLIGRPDWRNLHECTQIEEFTAITLGYAWVDFAFPLGCRFPSMPVRTENGLVFPLRGRTYVSAPELVAARALGCQIKIRKGVIIPTDTKTLIFGDFIKECIANRMSVGSKSLEGLFWKEISNSTYGKTAQGLRVKRVYDMRDREMKPLPESTITNCAFASFITSFVRALLAECMNKVAGECSVFSCTTDGFLTNHPESKISQLTKGELGRLYSKARKVLTDQEQVLEVKHRIRQPLGWRTRGQATLKPHDDLKFEPEGILLAKGGIYTAAQFEEPIDRNDEIVRLFFNRTATSEIRVETLTGVREIVELDADLVSKEVVKRLSMEYDWKRQPTNLSLNRDYNHVQFATLPWETVEKFKQIRLLWEGYNKSSNHCIKSLSDFDAFADYVEIHSHAKEITTYLKKKDPDIHRLRQLLCSAWQQNKAGLKKGIPKTASEFAQLLESIGLSCKRADVENGAKRAFERHSCPPTTKVLEILSSLKAFFPRLQMYLFLAKPINAANVTIRPILFESLADLPITLEKKRTEPD
jgi:hypothetical protein